MSQYDGIYPILKSLLLQDKYSDLTIKCGGQEFKAHRAVVCSQSSFFAAACDSGLKESSAGVIELPEDDPETLIRFLQFLYTGNYEDGEYPTQEKPASEATMDTDEIQRELEQAPGILTGGLSGESQDPSHRTMVNDKDDKHDSDYEISSPNTEPDEEYSLGSEAEEADEEGPSQCHEYVGSRTISLFISLRVYVMADKFDVPSLKLLARHRFYNTAREIFQTYSGFPAVVDELYETTAPTDYIIREIPCRLIAASYPSNGSNSTGFETLMCKHGDLAVGVLKYSLLYWFRPKCDGCSAKFRSNRL
ncbi:BTB/POZ protein [Trichoderma velutinum]